MNAMVEVEGRALASVGEALASEAGQYLTFMLSGESYAIGILSLKEIIEYDTLTEVPLMPACIRGVINLRGAVVPVMDLQARFGRKRSEVTKRTCIVIVEVASNDQHTLIGVVVDAVNEVLDIEPNAIEPAPSFGSRIRNDFIRGIGKVRGRFVILLNVDQVLSLDVADALAQAEGLVESAGA